MCSAQQPANRDCDRNCRIWLLLNGSLHDVSKARRCVPCLAIEVFSRARGLPRLSFELRLRIPSNPAEPLSLPKNFIRADSPEEAESSHDAARCSRSSICLQPLSATCSGRGASLKWRTFFFDTS